MIVDIQSSAVAELMTHLTSKLPSEFSVMDEFPGPNQKLNYPSVSITPSRTRINLKYPRLMSYSDVEGTVATVNALYIVANVEIPLQIDLWFMSSDQRKYYLELFTNAMIGNPARSADLNLLLTNHYNIPANYQVDDSISFQDTNNDTLVSEHRAKMDVICNTELVVTKEEYKFLHITLHTKYYVNNPELIKEMKDYVVF